MSSLWRTARILRCGLQPFRRGTQQITVRNSGDIPPYRQHPHIDRKQMIDADMINGFMWFWIMWHFWHHPDAVLGHFPWPDSSKWTNEELGIPPDDEQ